MSDSDVVDQGREAWARIRFKVRRPTLRALVGDTAQLANDQFRSHTDSMLDQRVRHFSIDPGDRL